MLRTNHHDTPEPTTSARMPQIPKRAGTLEFLVAHRIRREFIALRLKPRAEVGQVLQRGQEQP